MSIANARCTATAYYRLNLALGAGYGLANLAVLLALPWLIHTDTLKLGWLWVGLAVPVVLSSNGFWALQHEAIHNLFAVDQRLNKLAGRAMAILFGSSFRVLRFGHLMHHRFSRHPLDRPDCFDPTVTPAWIARLRFFVEICGGLYLTEIVLPLLAWLPRPLIHRLFDRVYAGPDPRLQALRLLAKQALGSDRAIFEVRQDSAVVILVYGSAFALWGNLWWLLAGFILIRGLMISFLDNVYHFRTPVDDPDFALNLSLPRPFQALILNMNFHRLHHHNMHLPWWSLPGHFALTGARHDGSYLCAALAQLAGPAPIDQLTSQRSAKNHCAPKLCID